MPSLTPEGQRLVQELARRYDFGEDAVAQMLAAVVAGQGRMAQFAHPEFGGSGQWMSGGMLMLGDMFNNALKSRVTGLCTDLSNALAAAGPLVAPAQSQSQTQGNGGEVQLPDTPFFEPAPNSNWWPTELGTPSSSGSQNSMRYAWFADAHRLAIESHGDVVVYDTLDHRIGGFSQQQGGGEGLSMSSQHGTIDIASLPVVSRNGQAPAQPRQQSQAPDVPAVPAIPDVPPPAPAAPPVRAAPAAPAAPTRASSPAKEETSTSVAATNEPTPTQARAAVEDPVQLITRLGELHERGLLSDEEFTAKKQELLSRL